MCNLSTLLIMQQGTLAMKLFQLRSNYPLGCNWIILSRGNIVEIIEKVKILIP